MQSLLTSFFAPFLAARESDFSSRFFYLWFSKYHVVHAPPYFWHTLRIFSKQVAHGNLVQGLVPVLFPRSAFRRRFSCKRLLGARKSYLFSHLKFLELTFSCMTKAYAKPMQYSSGKELPKDFQSLESKLIVVCLMIASGQLPKHSLHLFTFQLFPCTLFKLIVRTFLMMKSFAVASSMDPCHLACVSKSVPRDVVPLIGCSNQLPRSVVGVTRVTRG
jgi:hypothetical protein